MLGQRASASYICFGLLRKMIDHAWEWATKNKKVRVNAVHGEQEIYIVLTETFELENVEQEETIRRGSMEVEARLHACHAHFCPGGQDEDGALLESDLPTIDHLNGVGASEEVMCSTKDVMTFKPLSSNTCDLFAA